MPSTTVQTSHIPLFNGDYFAECQVSWSTNTQNRTITVTIDGFRRYSKYEWNFSSDITLRISNSQSGTGAQEVTGATGFPNGGKVTTGYWPKSGFDNSLHVSKVFNYNSDGTVPDIWIYIRNQNYSVEWISQGTHHGWDINGNVNIKSKISAISAISPTIQMTKGSFNATSVNWTAKCTNGINCDRWEYKVDNGSWNVYSSSNTTSTTGRANVSSKVITVYVRARRTGSSTYSNTVSQQYDCTIPPIYNAKISPNSSTIGILSFTSSYNVQYYLDNNYLGTVNKNTNPNKSVSLKNNSLSNYTLKIARTDNTAITNSTTISNVDSRVPRITVSYNITGTTCTVTATADSTCNNWYYTLDGVRYNLPSGSRSSITFTIKNMIVNHTYTLIVYATRTSSGLQGSSTPVYPEPKGCIRIFDGGSSKAASVYIWIPSRGWVAAIPYVWDDGEWKMGT